MFFSFSKEIRNYDQIRFIDETGQEIIRVDFDGGRPESIPQKLLQNKAERYYFKDTMKLGRREVYVSPLDLNVENGQVEQPHRPMIRFGTPIFDHLGQKRGVIIINYCPEWIA